MPRVSSIPAHQDPSSVGSIASLQVRFCRGPACSAQLVVWCSAAPIQRSVHAEDACRQTLSGVWYLSTDILMTSVRILLLWGAQSTKGHGCHLLAHEQPPAGKASADILPHAHRHMHYPPASSLPSSCPLVQSGRQQHDVPHFAASVAQADTGQLPSDPAVADQPALHWMRPLSFRRGQTSNACVWCRGLPH